MARAIGIIAEYNPLHNGHAFQLALAQDLARQLEAAQQAPSSLKRPPILVAMSGYFCQRGIPALMDPQERARLAIELGADVVVQIPEYGSTQYADRFAKAALSVLLDLGISDLIFGMEDPDLLPLLPQVISIEQRHHEDFSKLIQAKQKSGLSYAQAWLDTLITLISDQNFSKSQLQHLKKGLASSNNLLALAYLRVLLQDERAKQITLHAHSRAGHMSEKESDSHSLFSEKLSIDLRAEDIARHVSGSVELPCPALASADEQNFKNKIQATSGICSAAFIREALKAPMSEDLALFLFRHCPIKSAIALLDRHIKKELLFFPALASRIRISLEAAAARTHELPEYQNGLLDRLQKLLRQSVDLRPEDKISALISQTGKHWSKARIQRALLHLTLGPERFEKLPDLDYIYLYAFTPKGRFYLNQRPSQATPIFTQLSQVKALTAQSIQAQLDLASARLAGELQNISEREAFASHARYIRRRKETPCEPQLRTLFDSEKKTCQIVDLPLEFCSVDSADMRV